MVGVRGPRFPVLRWRLFHCRHGSERPRQKCGRPGLSHTCVARGHLPPPYRHPRGLPSPFHASCPPLACACASCAALTTPKSAKHTPGGKGQQSTLPAERAPSPPPPQPVATPAIFYYFSCAARDGSTAPAPAAQVPPPRPRREAHAAGEERAGSKKEEIYRRMEDKRKERSARRARRAHGARRAAHSNGAYHFAWAHRTSRPAPCRTPSPRRGAPDRFRTSEPYRGRTSKLHDGCPSGSDPARHFVAERGLCFLSPPPPARLCAVRRAARAVRAARAAHQARRGRARASHCTLPRER